MRLKIRFPLRHPLYPEWAVTPARAAKGRSIAVSGTLRELLAAAAAGVTAERAVFVMHCPDTVFLKDADRELLWHAFQVPVLACLLDGDGRLVGYECEAQDGLHIAGSCPSDTERLELTSEDSILGYRVPLEQTIVDSSPCECGRPGQRLRFTGERTARRLALVEPRKGRTPSSLNGSAG